MKLREMTKKGESLWAAYSFSKLLLPVAIFGPVTPILYETCTFKFNATVLKTHVSLYIYSIPTSRLCTMYIAYLNS